MELSVECIAMLEHINAPAFFAKDGCIIHVNKLASKLDITENSLVSNIIHSDSIESEIHTICIRGQYYDVSASAIGEHTMYVLNLTANTQQLQSVMRAAQHLRIPLGGLSSSVRTLKDLAEGQENDQVIAATQNALKQLFSIQRTVRNMAEITDLVNNFIDEKHTVNASAFFSELAEKLSTYLEQSNIKITYSIPDEEIYCNLDTNLLERAVYNMISNSLKAGSRQINIELNKTGKKLHLTVTDDGHGISEQEKKVIFSKLKQQPSLQHNELGLGLGMLIIHAAAKAHDGTLLIKDAQPSGCKITLTMDCSSSGILRQNVPTLRVNAGGGIDPIVMELAEYLPAEYL